MQNRFVISVLLTITILSSGVAAQNRGVLTADPAFYAVSFVEVMPGSKAAAVAALKQYRDASRKDEASSASNCSSKLDGRLTLRWWKNGPVKKRSMRME